MVYVSEKHLESFLAITGLATHPLQIIDEGFWLAHSEDLPKIFYQGLREECNPPFDVVLLEDVAAEDFGVVEVLFKAVNGFDLIHGGWIEDCHHAAK